MGYTQAQTADSSRAQALNTLIQAGGLFMGYSGTPTPAEIKLNSACIILHGKPFHEIKDMLRHSNALTRAYGFMLGMETYRDSMQASDIGFIFADTAQLCIYSSTGIQVQDMSQGEFFHSWYSQENDTGYYAARKKDAQEAIRTFILKNARFPQSYSPQGFSGFRYSYQRLNTTYELRHGYSLQQNNGNNVTTQHYFVLDRHFRIVLIESIRSNKMLGYPPETGEWLQTFGHNK